MKKAWTGRPAKTQKAIERSSALADKTRDETVDVVQSLNKQAARISDAPRGPERDRAMGKVTKRLNPARNAITTIRNTAAGIAIAEMDMRDDMDKAKARTANLKAAPKRTAAKRKRRAKPLSQESIDHR